MRDCKEIRDLVSDLWGGELTAETAGAFSAMKRLRLEYWGWAA